MATVLGERLGAVDVFELRPRIGLSSAAFADSLPGHEKVGDVVLTAAYAVADLRRSLANQLQGLNATIDPAPTLQIGPGVRERLSVDDGQGYWPRLIVTDADAPDIACPPECYQERCLSPIPPEVRQRLLARTASAVEVKGLVEKASEPKAQRYLPERLKYVFLSQRARAETLEQKGQPGLIEAIIKRQRNTSTFNPKLASTLFHLMIPVDYKAVAREKSRLLLILDSYTATLPWELLQADDQPLATRTPMIRQLITARFRGQLAFHNEPGRAAWGGRAHHDGEISETGAQGLGH